MEPPTADPTLTCEGKQGYPGISPRCVALQVGEQTFRALFMPALRNDKSYRKNKKLPINTVG